MYLFHEFLKLGDLDTNTSNKAKAVRDNVISVEGPDIACLTEIGTKLSDLTPSGYNRCENTTGGTGGGVAIMSKNSIDSYTTLDFNDSSGKNAIGAKTTFNGQQIYVVCIHLYASVYFTDPLNETKRKEEIDKVVNDLIVADNAWGLPIIIAGDFNCGSHLDWADWKGNSASNYTSGDTTDGGADWKISRYLLGSEMEFKDSGKTSYIQVETGDTPKSTWKPLGYTPTGFEHERIDFVYYRRFDSVTGFATTDYSESDHMCVSVTISTNTTITIPNEPSGPPGDSVTVDTNPVASGNNFDISFDGPGNAKDWIGVYSDGASPSSGSLLWYYINGSQTSGTGSSSGTVTFNSGAENSSPYGQWPLSSGTTYDVYFLENDGYTVLAQTSFTTS